MHWVWISLFLRSGLILAAAEILRRISRRASPANRHRIVLAAFAMLLIWPLAATVLPEIPLPVWPRFPVHDSVTVQQTFVAFGRKAPSAVLVNWPLMLWIAGALLALAPVLIGYLNILGIARKATPLRNAHWQQLLEEICAEFHIETPPELLIAPVSLIPLTFSLRRPRILLPPDSIAWTALRRRAVLLHELAHIRRRDIFAQLFANLMNALWWFQPLCWMSRWSLRRESERACDALVVASGIRPSDYASELLYMAQHFQAPRHCASAGIAIARRQELEGRLLAILDPRPVQKGKRLSLAAISILTILTVTASAVTVLPQPETVPSGGSPMKRTVFAGLLASAGLSAATIGGSLFDATGAAIPNAKASLYNPDTAAVEQTTTTTDGKFAFDNLPAGSYILRIEKPGFALLLRAFNVEADTDVQRGLFLKSPSTTAQSASADPQPGNAGALRVGGQVAEANLIKKVQPVYPVSAKADRLQGTVELGVAISKEGVPQEISVITSPRDDLTQSAIEAVRQWRYRPTLLNGEPVDIVTDVIVNYTLLP